MTLRPLLRQFARPRVALLLLSLAGGGLLAGCASTPKDPIVVRQEFKAYDKVAISARMTREDEDYFIPLYMAAFPRQHIVDGRDLATAVGNPHLLPEQFDVGVRENLRKNFGVKAVLFPNLSANHLAIKAIDTTSGEITMSVLIVGSDPAHPESTKSLIDRAIAELKSQGVK